MTTTPTPAKLKTKNAIRTWTDEKTGRTIRQLTEGKHGGTSAYFRLPRHVPGGAMLARIGGHAGVLLDPETGEYEPIRDYKGGYLKMRTSDGRLWTLDPKTREIWSYDLAAGAGVGGVLVGRVPEEVKGVVADITCDGRTVILLDHFQYQNENHPAPTKLDAAMFWHYIARPRHGSMVAYDLITGKSTTLASGEDYCPFHVDTSPLDPTLVRYAHDRFEGENQRVWSIRTDGSEMKKIRPQEFGELVTHEFWWAGGKDCGYSYQDRRKDPTARDLPWCEYSKSKTQLGIADPSGKEIYLSDPVNHYHTHLYTSFNGKLVSGSGTDGHSFAYAALFDRKSTKIDYIPLATIHTPYVPFQGQQVNCDFSADGKWLLFSDTTADGFQLCAVEVKL